MSARVELDALVLAKMAAHHASVVAATTGSSSTTTASAAAPVMATGQLLGLEEAGEEASLAITNCFPSAEQPAAPENQSYAVEYLRALRRVHYDVNVVGWYQTARIGSFWNAPFIQTQFEYQKLAPQSVVLIYDIGLQGHILKAYRLTPAFMRIYEGKSFTMESLSQHRLTPAQIFEAIPITLTNTDLAHAFLEGNVAPATAQGVEAASLEFSSTLFLEERLEAMSGLVDDIGQDAWRYQGWQRSFHKEQQRINATIYKRKQDNAARAAQGLEPEWSAADLSPEVQLAKVKANEPSRLDPMLMDNQIRSYCDSLHEYAEVSLSKMYAAQCLGFATAPGSSSA